MFDFDLCILSPVEEAQVTSLFVCLRMEKTRVYLRGLKGKYFKAKISVFLHES